MKKALRNIWAIACCMAFPAGAEELAITSNRPATNTYVQGDNIRLTFEVSDGKPDAVLEFSLADENDREVIEPQKHAVTLDAHGNGEFSAAFPSGRLGYYSVKASLGDGTVIAPTGTRPKGVFTYAVVVDPLRREDYGDLRSRFGMQGGFSREANVIPLLGVRHVLQQGADWATAEAAHPGQFSESIKTERAAGKAHFFGRAPSVEGILYGGRAWQTYVTALLTTGKLPKWAIEPMTLGKVGIGLIFSSVAPDERQALTEFAATHAREIAHDYPDQPEHIYQVTWEPMFPDCYGGTATQLVEFYRLTYTALHANDPKAKVAGPTLHIYPASTEQLKGLLAAGLADYLDIFSLHAYYNSTAWPFETSGYVEALRQQIAMVKEAAHKDLPFISTEHGFESEQYGLLNHALANVRSTVILLGEGSRYVINFYIADSWNTTPETGGQSWGFYWNLNPKIEYGTDRLGPKPVVPAYAALTYLLDGSVSQGLIPGTSKSQMGYRFAKGSEQVSVLWDYAGSSDITLPAAAHQVTVCDWMGNCGMRPVSNNRLALTLGAEPVYVIQSTSPGPPDGN